MVIPKTARALLRRALLRHTFNIENLRCLEMASEYVVRKRT